MFNGKKLAYQRNLLGLSQEQLAKKLNVSLSSIAMYETNKRQPDDEAKKKMSELFGVSIDYLLDNDENSKIVAELTYDDTEKTNMQKMITDELGRTLFKKYGDLSDKDKRIILATINQIIENTDKED